MQLKCPKCGSQSYGVSKDARGLLDAVCSECGAHIKKMSVAEIVDFYENRDPVTSETNATESKPLCKWCTERWGVNQGLGFRKLDIKYCPMCGRKTLPTDKNY